MRKDIVIAVLAIVTIAAVTFGLAKMRPDLVPTPSHPFSDAKESATPSPKSGKVVMRVNNQPVTEAEFTAFLNAVPEQQRAVFAGPSGRRELANELVRMKMLEQEATRLGVDKEPEVLTQLSLLKTQVIASRALQKIVEQKAEKEIGAAYEREKKNALSLRHIVIAYAGGMVPPRVKDQPAPSADQAIKKAAALVARLRGGADFGQVARSDSDDVESAQRGGSLGPMRPDVLPPEIAGVVSKLKPGQFSDPVKTQFGVHVFNVTEPTLEDLKPMLLQQVQQEIAKKELERLQAAAKVDLDPQFFPAVPGAPKAPAPPPAQQ